MLPQANETFIEATAEILMSLTLHDRPAKSKMIYTTEEIQQFAAGTPRFDAARCQVTTCIKASTISEGAPWKKSESSAGTI